MPTPQKHATIIKAWADGLTVQRKRQLDTGWEDIVPFDG